ncbi:MAG TPA: hypothetical protein ENI86_05500 [Acidimicrobiales bacterium]|nr:hypothetical protein [Acidimicrobiales bacterium]
MGLIARQLEAAGIPTVCLTSARDITRAVNPPRAAFLDFPLGHTSGRPHQPELNREIVSDALRAFEVLTVPGSMLHLRYHWADDDSWKDGVMRPASDTGEDASGAKAADDRVERFDTPQYQCDADAEAAEASHGSADCMVCAGIDY